MVAKESNCLKERLEDLYRTYHRSYLATDPLLLVHRYRRPEDQEVVGFLASSLAYGRVEHMVKTLERIFAVMGPSPHAFARRFIPSRHSRLFDPITYRFHTGRDIASLLYAIRQMLEGWGSIETFFLSRTEGGNGGMKGRIEGFSSGVLGLDDGPFGWRDGPSDSGFRFTFPLPSRGSACKRLNLFLRWMVRKNDGLDLGLWRSIDPSELIIPLDTHVSRVAHAIGLTDHRQPSWKAACDVTSSLASLNPSDPVKYDFSLCRLGILKECPSRRLASRCRACLLDGICRFSSRQRK